MSEQEKKWRELYLDYKLDFDSNFDRKPNPMEAFLEAKRQDAERIAELEAAFDKCSNACSGLIRENSELRAKLDTLEKQEPVAWVDRYDALYRFNHPSIYTEPLYAKHYTSHPSGIECIQIAEHMGFNLGNTVKYVWRADLKHDAIEDLRKAKWYIERELKKRQRKVRK